MSLFTVADAQDVTYRCLLGAPLGEDEHAKMSREFVDQLWLDTADYLNSDLPQRATEQFHQCFWEMYLGKALRDAGVELVPRLNRVPRQAGPDLKTSPTVWFEAIAVTQGVGPDAVVAAPLHELRPVPDDQINLRLLSAFAEKRVKYEKYQKSRLIDPTEPTVVAINAALVPSASLEREIPRIVRALLELGDEALVVDIVSRKVVDHVHLHKPVMLKRSGSGVPMGMFLDRSSTIVSACLYSCVDVFSIPQVHGRDFVLLHNPTAAAPLPQGMLKRGNEFWVEGDQLHSVNHNAA